MVDKTKTAAQKAGSQRKLGNLLRWRREKDFSSKLQLQKMTFKMKGKQLELDMQHFLEKSTLNLEYQKENLG